MEEVTKCGGGLVGQGLRPRGDRDGDPELLVGGHGPPHLNLAALGPSASYHYWFKRILIYSLYLVLFLIFFILFIFSYF